MNTLIIPSNREESLKSCLDYWMSGAWDHIIVVEDNPQKTFELDESIYHVAWEDIENDPRLKGNSWIFSKRDSAIRSYGFFFAWHLGADYVFTIDDDCAPFNMPVLDFINGHINQIEKQDRWTTTAGVRTRGIPYFNKGKLNNIVLNMGLWKGVPDLDSVQTLSGQKPEIEYNNRIVPVDQYFPMCGMNVCFKKTITPLMYFPLMGENYPYRRFDDIWCGIIVKKVCDHLGLLVSVGEPYLIHSKASDPMVNLVKEAPGIAANEWFWETIDNINLNENTPAKCMIEIGNALLDHKEEYIAKLGKAIQIWANLFIDRA